MESKTCANPKCGGVVSRGRGKYCSDACGESVRNKRTYEKNKKNRLAGARRYARKNKKKVLAQKRRYYEANKERWRERRKTVDGKLKEYKQGAARRGYEWALTDEQALKLFSESCFYDGEPGGGIDRWDNSIGYTLENCVPCCARCNRTKGTMNGEEFIAHAMKITRHMVGVVENFLSQKEPGAIPKTI